MTNTGEELGYDTDLTYCLGCMLIATAALEAASGIDRFTESIDDERMALRPDIAMLAGDGGDRELCSPTTWTTTPTSWCSTTRRWSAAKPTASPSSSRCRNGAWPPWKPGGPRSSAGWRTPAARWAKGAAALAELR